MAEKTTTIKLPEYDDYETAKGVSEKEGDYLIHKYFRKGKLIAESFVYYETKKDPDIGPDNPAYGFSMRWPSKMVFKEYLDSGKIIISSS